MLPPNVLRPGTSIGRYEIVGALGAGGMGEVYRARDSRLQRDVALKILPDSFADDPERRSRFEREAQAIAALSHPNVLAVHDTGVHEGHLFVVTELLEGETLAERHDTGQRASFWSIPFTGGRPTLLVRFSDPLRESIRRDFAVGAGQFFFTLEDRQADIWVADAVPSRAGGR